MYRFIPSSAFLTAQEELFPNAGTTQNDIRVAVLLQPNPLSTYQFSGSQYVHVPLGISQIRRRAIGVYVLPFKNSDSWIALTPPVPYWGYYHRLWVRAPGGEMDTAFMAAMQAYEGHQPGDNEARRVVGLMIHVAINRATGCFWKNMWR